MRPIRAIEILQKRNQSLVNKCGRATEYTRESDEVIATFAEVINRAAVLEDALNTIEAFLDENATQDVQLLRQIIALALRENKTASEYYIEQTEEAVAECDDYLRSRQDDPIDWDSAELEAAAETEKQQAEYLQ